MKIRMRAERLGLFMTKGKMVPAFIIKREIRMLFQAWQGHLNALAENPTEPTEEDGWKLLSKVLDAEDPNER